MILAATALVAAGALALGMQPVFRVVQQPGGGGHVTAVVQTQDGRLVNVDPVGHPKMAFGAVYSPAGWSVRYYDLNGQELPPAVSGPLERTLRMHTGSLFDARGPYAVNHQLGHYPQRSGPMGAIPDFTMNPVAPTSAVAPAGTGPGLLPTAVTSIDGMTRTVTPHTVILGAYDVPGARVLVRPEYAARVFRSGGVMERAPATDQYGRRYMYRSNVDAFVPETANEEGTDCPMGTGLALCQRAQAKGLQGMAGVLQYTASAGAYMMPTTRVPGQGDGADLGGMGDLGSRRRRRRRRDRRRRIRARRRARRKRVARRARRRLKKFGRRVRRAFNKTFGRVFKAIGKLVRRLGVAALRSPALQHAAAAALKVFGVPRAVTKLLMKILAKAMKQRWIRKLTRLIFRGKWKRLARFIKKIGVQTLRMGADAVKNAVKNLGSGGLGSLAGADTERHSPLAEAIADTETDYLGTIHGRTYRMAAVPLIEGIGQVDEDQDAVMDEPAPGRWVRARKGQGLLNFAEQVLRAQGLSAADARKGR
ncbi:MAG: hypothetical protein HRU14_17670, partial [Planctomycetes bacterium]|nr:hypothetical protein [Planctomycetota bacterium]